MKLKKFLKFILVIFCLNFFKQTFATDDGKQEAFDLQLLQKYEQEDQSGITTYKIAGIATALAAAGFIGTFLYKVKDWDAKDRDQKEEDDWEGERKEYKAYWRGQEIEGRENIIQAFREAKMDRYLYDWESLHLIITKETRRGKTWLTRRVEKSNISTPIYPGINSEEQLVAILNSF